MFIKDRRGAGMPEAMLGIVLFSLLAVALLRYLQWLEQAQADLLQHQAALEMAHQALEGYRQPAAGSTITPPPGWRLTLSQQPRDGACHRVYAEAVTASGRRVGLAEWFCVPFGHGPLTDPLADNG